MVTREQIERIEIGGSNDQWEMQGPIDKGHIVEILRLALVAIDGERDRKLGAAVRTVLNEVPTDSAALIRGDHEEVCMSGLADRLLTAIAAALRGEP